MLLARPDPWKDKDFKTFVSNKYYSYISGLSKEARERELTELAFHTRRVSTILVFATTGRWDIFLPYCLQHKSDRLEGRVHNIKFENDNYLEETRGSSNKSLAIDVVVEPFSYPDNLVEIVHQLDWAIIEKNNVLAYDPSSSSKEDITLWESNQFSDLACKSFEELEKSLGESQKS